MAEHQASLNDYAVPLKSFDTPGETDYFEKLRGQELLDHAVPPQPDERVDPVLHQHWAEILRGVTRLEEAEFAGDLGSETERGFLQTTIETSRNWSGAWCAPCHGQKFKSVVGKWKVPRVTGATRPSAYQPNSSTWIGFGGHRRWSLAMPQMGSEHLATSFDGTKQERYVAWVQWWVRTSVAPPFQAQYFARPIFAPGDTILCWIELISSKRAHFFLRKETDFRLYRKVLDMTASNVKGVDAHGYSAQWIVERPRVADGTGKNYFPLANFTNVQFLRWHAASVTPQKTSPQMIRLIERHSSPQRPEIISRPGLRPVTGKVFDVKRVGPPS